jgi:hypothetical protein
LHGFSYILGKKTCYNAALLHQEYALSLPLASLPRFAELFLTIVAYEPATGKVIVSFSDIGLDNQIG